MELQFTFRGAEPSFSARTEPQRPISAVARQLQVGFSGPSASAGALAVPTEPTFSSSFSPDGLLRTIGLNSSFGQSLGKLKTPAHAVFLSLLRSLINLLLIVTSTTSKEPRREKETMPVSKQPVALIVGASRGIGRQVAIDIAANGYAGMSTLLLDFWPPVLAN